jgi:hypothetical protein
MRIFWLKSRRWTYEQLDDKSVEFRITYPNGFAEGIGLFLVRGNGVEKMAIDIIVSHVEEYYTNHYHLTDSLAEEIEPHPDQSVAQFRCIGQFDPSSQSSG